MKKKFSETFVKIKERRIYTRIIAIVFLIVAFFGMWGPLAKMKLSFGISGPFGNEIITYDKVEAGSVSLRNFANFSNVGDIVVFDKSLDSFSIGNVNIYNFIKNPPQASKHLSNVIDKLDVETLESFSDESLKANLMRISPKYGENIFNVTSSISKTLLSWREVLVSANDVVKDGQQVLNQASDILNRVEQTKTVLNVLVFIFFVFALIPIVLLLIPKIPPIAPRILAYLSLGMVLGLILGILLSNFIVNILVQNMVADLNGYINNNLNLLLAQILGDKAGILSLLGGLSRDYIRFSTNIVIGWGIIISVISYVIAIVASHFIPKRDIKRTEDIK